MSVLQVLVYAIVQGITELFPVSSVGHSVILPYVLGWQDVSSNPQFLPFVVMLHVGTALALVLYFWRDWVRILSSPFPGGRREDRRLLLLIITATIPAAIIGKIFEHRLRDLFPSAWSAALFLIVNGLVLLAADRIRTRRRRTIPANRLSLAKSFAIGTAQVLALIPGFSRSGVTMAAGLASGLEYADAAHFGFLLATPVILGAGVLEIPKAMRAHDPAMLHAGLLGGLLTGLIAVLSTHILMRYFRGHEVQALRPFAYYCIVVGAVVLGMASLHLHL